VGEDEFVVEWWTKAYTLLKRAGRRRKRKAAARAR
jgi:hypothetical protein